MTEPGFPAPRGCRRADGTPRANPRFQGGSPAAADLHRHRPDDGDAVVLGCGAANHIRTDNDEGPRPRDAR
jgi:hypothetical protein